MGNVGDEGHRLSRRANRITLHLDGDAMDQRLGEDDGNHKTECPKPGEAVVAKGLRESPCQGHATGTHDIQFSGASAPGSSSWDSLISGKMLVLANSYVV